MTPFEFSLYSRGRQRTEFDETTRVVSTAYLGASLTRSKRMPPLKNFLPQRKLTKVEQSKKLWQTIKGLSVMGVGKVKVNRKKK